MVPVFSSKWRGEGILLNPKNYVADFCVFLATKICNTYDFRNGEGDSEGESLLVWGKRFSFFSPNRTNI